MSLFLLILMLSLTSFTIVAQELNTILMESTFKIVGRTHVDTVFSVGTIFIVARPYKDMPGQGRLMLVTANHVLDRIFEDTATVFFRKRISPGEYEIIPDQVPIRLRGKPLWTRHPDKDIDVAVMKTMIPSGLGLNFLPTNYFASDSVLQYYEIHPGDELYTLGFPFGIDANVQGFPVLRSGKIASYPLTPTKVIRKFLFDMNIYEGNSGGPVYFSYTGRAYQGSINMTEVSYLVGLITEQAYDPWTRHTPLQIAIVIPSSFILETLDNVP